MDPEKIRILLESRNQLVRSLLTGGSFMPPDIYVDHQKLLRHHNDLIRKIKVEEPQSWYDAFPNTN